MQDITSKEEQYGRRQFSRLFCGEVLHMCSKNTAINDTSWDEVILDDILHRAYPHNLLTTEKIKVIMVMLGWSNDILFFGKSTDKTINDWIFPYIADHISMAAYVQFEQTEIPNPTKTIVQFYKKFCTHNSNAPLRITTNETYKLYVTWCNNTNRYPMALKTFYTTLAKLGAVKTKGYCEGKSGVTYYLLKLNPEEVLNDEQQEISQTKTQQETDECPKPLRNVNRARETIFTETTKRETAKIPKSEKEPNTTASNGRNDHNNESNNAIVISPDKSEFNQQFSTPSKNPNISNNSSQNIIEQSSNFKNFTPTTNSKTEPSTNNNVQHTRNKTIQYPNDPTNIIGRLKQLPIGFRPTFDEIRVCCKIAMDPFTEEQFTAMANDAGFHFTPTQISSLYDFLIEYAKADLRELKKGAIQ